LLPFLCEHVVPVLQLNCLVSVCNSYRTVVKLKSSYTGSFGWSY